MGKIVTLDSLNKRLAARRDPMRLPLVKLCVPYYGNSILEPCIDILEELVGKGMQGYRFEMVKKSGTIIEFSRNELIEQPKLDWQYLFFLDTDVGFTLKDNHERPDGYHCKTIYLMKKILDNDLDICGGIYCSRGVNHLPLVFNHSKNSPGLWENILELPSEGVQEVAAIATGFLCIKRNVIKAFDDEFERRERVAKNFEKIKSDELEKLDKRITDYLAICKPDIRPPFWVDYVYSDYDGRWMPVGEDIFFCREAAKLGFKIHADFSVRLGHMSTLMFTPEHYEHAYQEKAINEKAKFAESRKSPIIISQKEIKEAMNG